jgi:isochorismatase family protein
LKELLPDPRAVSRPGKINAWDNKEFVDAVEKSGKQLIVTGVSTEVCVAFVALSAVKDGYDVFAVIDASGTWNKLVHEVPIARMSQAGLVPITWVALAGELQRDWRNRPACNWRRSASGPHFNGTEKVRNFQNLGGRNGASALE